jgi:hypothetical protein
MHYCGLDVSLRATAICVVDAEGAIVKEAKVASDPDAIGAFLRATGLELGRVGLEAGSTSSWLHAGLRAQGWPAWSASTPATPRRRSGPASGTRATATTRAASRTRCG